MFVKLREKKKKRLHFLTCLVRSLFVFILLWNNKPPGFYFVLLSMPFSFAFQNFFRCYHSQFKLCHILRLNYTRLIELWNRYFKMIIYGHVRCLGFSLMLDCVSVLDLELVAIVEWLMQYIAATFHAHAWVVLRYMSAY
ncbi:unnamed protein product [Citrullus colocynthis]|uniref:Uncharacterized protein n=1 Tax=Citrullus colocynthis TaxID=252529 RepID=A0ABP0Y7E5_9ROSI